MKLKKKIYNVLVARKPPIRYRYVKYKALGKSPLKRAVYLFKLNFSYYILKDRRLSKYGGVRTRPYSDGAESGLNLQIAPEKLALELSGFDAVSFDIFDTLILRPFAAPVDLFHIVGAEAELLNFAEIREHCEKKAREQKHLQCGSFEINIDDIYDYMEEFAGTGYEAAKDKELEAEMNLCRANPYIKKVWDLLIEKKVKIFIISDMYLKSDYLEKLLEKNGFSGFEKLLVSSENGCSKRDGGLYEIAKKYMPKGRLAHVGDNPHSDIAKSTEHGFTAFGCKNVNNFGAAFRPADMSKIVGSAYSGLVNGKLHCGLEEYPILYEYGYVYSGIFVLGFCGFIHRIRSKRQADKVLFLARDGDLLKKVYDKLYPDENTEYFLWSRLAAVKLCFLENTYDFLRRFIYHKCGYNFTAAKLLEQMELGELSDECPLKNTVITDKNYKELERFIIERRDKIALIYGVQTLGAQKYFDKKLSGSQKVLAVDVGWAGSGGAAIGTLCKKWGFGTEVIGVVAGTNDSFSEQPDASEGLLQSGKMYSYCFSQSHNRNIYLTHDSAQSHNAFFEMLLGSESASLKGFDADGEPVFSENEDENRETVRLIHRGALDFCNDYIKAFAEYPYMLNISGNDAYAPFLSAIEDKNRYFGAALKGRVFNFGVGTEGKTLEIM